mmetsp:Transcript_24673/g.68806  ORF Transcript_24673/g.68806 Transcript_24673/m.68806 type:complete len:202 (-) Transcript_24673:314-919(-)
MLLQMRRRSLTAGVSSAGLPSLEKGAGPSRRGRRRRRCQSSRSGREMVPRAAMRRAPPAAPSRRRCISRRAPTASRALGGPPATAASWSRPPWRRRRPQNSRVWTPTTASAWPRACRAVAGGRTMRTIPSPRGGRGRSIHCRAQQTSLACLLATTSHSAEVPWNRHRRIMVQPRSLGARRPSGCQSASWPGRLCGRTPCAM